MGLEFESRLSDSAFVHKVWRIENERIESFFSVAKPHLLLMVGRQAGEVTTVLRGPESTATLAETPVEAEFLGIFFELGTYLPSLALDRLVNRQVDLQQTTGNRFYLHGDEWEVPTFENADYFVNALARAGILRRDESVAAVLRGERVRLTQRSIQRRFLRGTGLTRGQVTQILRAQHAAASILKGTPILDSVEADGYFDQAHMTKSLKRFYGQTPAELIHSPIPTSIY